MADSPKKGLPTANLTDFLTICCQLLLQNAHFFGCAQDENGQANQKRENQIFQIFQTSNDQFVGDKEFLGGCVLLQ